MKSVDLMSVSLTTPLDPYSLSNRAVKYGILFVVLTFGGFFIFELLKQLPIHAIQYLLVGLSLAIFFLLLVSFSEHMAFGFAYLIASIGCNGLLAFYLSFVLRSTARGVGFGAMLASAYASIYGVVDLRRQRIGIRLSRAVLPVGCSDGIDAQSGLVSRRIGNTAGRPGIPSAAAPP